MSTRALLLGVLGLLLAVVVVGPLIAPHASEAPIGPAYGPPAAAWPLGTDQLGRDVLSRVLRGGLPVVATSVAAAVAGSVVGATAGLLAALVGARRRSGEAAVLRPLDALAAAPPLLVLLLVLTAAPGRAGLVLAVVLVTAPLSARVARAAAAPVVSRGHVEAALVRGEGTAWLLGREVLPLVAGPLLADAGVRLVAAIYLVTAAGFLGLTPGDPDWGLLIVEALPGAELAPLALAAPVAAVAVLAVTVNLLADDAVRRGRSVLA